MPDPMTFLAGMVLENGRPWGQVATPEQRADAGALFDASGPRRHMWLRARGRSKTLDAAGAALSMMLAGVFAPGAELVCAAADRDQAKLVVRKVAGLVDRSHLRGQVQLEQYRASVPARGVALEVLAADAASSWGLTPSLLLVDEFANWPSGKGAREFIESLLTSLPKVPDSRAVLFSTPSSPLHWSHKLFETAVAESVLWRVSTHAGPAPWQDQVELAAEQRRLPEAMYRRLYLAEWVQADDVLTSLESVRAAVRKTGTLEPREGVAYVTGVDLSVTSDYSVAATCHGEPFEGGGLMLVVDAVKVWKPSRRAPVDMQAVEDYLLGVASSFGGQVVADKYQAHQLVQRLREAGVQAFGRDMTAGGNTHRALLLHRLIADGAIELPAEDEELVNELASLALRETTPGSYRLESVGKVGGHHDRSTAISLAAEVVLAPVSRGPRARFRQISREQLQAAARQRSWSA